MIHNVYTVNGIFSKNVIEAKIKTTNVVVAELAYAKKGEA